MKWQKKKATRGEVDKTRDGYLLDYYHLTYVSLFFMMFFFPLLCLEFNPHLLFLKKDEHIFRLHQGVNTWPESKTKTATDSGRSWEGLMTSLEWSAYSVGHSPSFSHITGAKGPRTRREMGSLLHSNLLWLGKAADHCSHHFPSVFTNSSERERDWGVDSRKIYIQGIRLNYWVIGWLVWWKEWHHGFFKIRELKKNSLHFL